MLRTENPGSLCACAIAETKQPPPYFANFHKNNRVGSRTEINLSTNGLRKAVAMTQSMALLKDILVHKAIHIIFYAFEAVNEG